MRRERERKKGREENIAIVNKKCEALKSFFVCKAAANLEFRFVCLKRKREDDLIKITECMIIFTLTRSPAEDFSHISWIFCVEAPRRKFTQLSMPQKLLATAKNE